MRLLQTSKAAREIDTSYITGIHTCQICDTVRTAYTVRATETHNVNLCGPCYNCISVRCGGCGDRIFLPFAQIFTRRWKFLMIGETDNHGTLYAYCKLCSEEILHLRRDPDWLTYYSLIMTILEESLQSIKNVRRLYASFTVKWSHRPGFRWEHLLRELVNCHINGVRDEPRSFWHVDTDLSISPLQLSAGVDLNCRYAIEYAPGSAMDHGNDGKYQPLIEYNGYREMSCVEAGKDAKDDVEDDDYTYGDMPALIDPKDEVGEDIDIPSDNDTDDDMPPLEEPDRNRSLYQHIVAAHRRGTWTDT